MYPVSPVLPDSTLPEVVLAKDQPQYEPLPVVRLPGRTWPIVSRWRFTDEDREEIAAGADLVLAQMTFGNLFHPVSLEVVAQDAMPAVLKKPPMEERA
jgi:hypothetical protein